MDWGFLVRVRYICACSLVDCIIRLISIPVLNKHTRNQFECKFSNPKYMRFLRVCVWVCVRACMRAFVCFCFVYVRACLCKCVRWRAHGCVNVYEHVFLSFEFRHTLQHSAMQCNALQQTCISTFWASTLLVHSICSDSSASFPKRTAFYAHQ